MFQLDWAQKKLWKREKSIIFKGKSNFDKEELKKIMLLHWEEHCVECAVPQCYNTCSLYSSRPDMECRRFAYGIYPNPAFKGLFNYGADIRFKQWGKLETKIYNIGFSVQSYRFLEFINSKIINLVNLFSDIFKFSSPRRKINVILFYYGEKLFNFLSNLFYKRSDFNDFIFEAFNPKQNKIKLILEYVESNVKFRHAFQLFPGLNSYDIPFSKFKINPRSANGRIRIYPEKNVEIRVIFTWLNFVKYRSDRKFKPPRAYDLPAQKVKCVAWDLDNTLWRGILVETRNNDVKLRKGVKNLIKKLDERGIIQTVVSKNNFDDAWAIINKFKLDHYFIYPAINWGQKSENLKNVAKKMNINIDTFALIDDSSFERGEVKSALPQVRVYSEKEIDTILSYSEFDVPITGASKRRRHYYLAQVKRDKVKESFSGDYEDYLASCNMEMKLFIPTEKNDVLRCWELLQRTNQLNLSGKSYTEKEFKNLLLNQEFLNIAFKCKDKYGDYGIVGFATIDESLKDPTLTNFVLSCRVAQKRVEHAFFNWLMSREKKRGKKRLLAKLVKTEKNKPLFQVFKDMHFDQLEKTDSNITLELSFNKTLNVRKIIKLKTDMN